MARINNQGSNAEQPSDLDVELKRLGFHDVTVVPEPELPDVVVLSNQASGAPSPYSYVDPELPSLPALSENEVIDKLCRGVAQNLLTRFGSQDWFEQFRSVLFREKGRDDFLNQVEEPVVFGICKEFAREVLGSRSETNVLLYDSKLDPFKTHSEMTIRLWSVSLSENCDPRLGQCALLVASVQNAKGEYFFPVPANNSSDFKLEKSDSPVLAAFLGRCIPRGPERDPVPQVIVSSVTNLRE